eukprot:NODE_587_length_5660_cov_0.522748.p5 type:complete len:122 gc:universal NODE_587_length_5660_cov_0.522748:4470-4835(+)
MLFDSICVERIGETPTSRKVIVIGFLFINLLPKIKSIIKKTRATTKFFYPVHSICINFPYANLNGVKYHEVTPVFKNAVKNMKLNFWKISCLVSTEHVPYMRARLFLSNITSSEKSNMIFP